MQTNRYNGAFLDKTNFTSEEYLHINSCGHNRYVLRTGAQEFCVFRPNGRVDYHILLVTEGQMEAVCGGVRERLTKGDAMLYGPGERQEYIFSVSEACPQSESLWIHFCGKSAPEIMRRAGLTHSGPQHPKSPDEARRIFESLLRSHMAGDPMTANGNLLRLLAQLSPDRAAPDSEAVRRLRAEAAYIYAHYSEAVDFNACAARCCLSRSRFSHLFAELMGEPPHRYQQRLRMEQARELLAYSTLSVGEIAAQLGYDDPLYFSRLFRRTVGQTPSEFRRPYFR